MVSDTHISDTHIVLQHFESSFIWHQLVKPLQLTFKKMKNVSYYLSIYSLRQFVPEIVPLKNWNQRVHTGGVPDGLCAGWGLI